MNINKIEGIGAGYAKKLSEADVKTTAALLKKGADRKGRKELAGQTDISEKLILNWVNKADLMRIKGVGEEFSDLLEVAGVDTVRELRNRNAENLHAKILEVNSDKNLVRRVPTAKEVTAWVAHAKELDPVVTY